MSDVLSQRQDPEDLSVQVRRGDASRAEQRGLARLLEQDETLQIAHRVGIDLDRDSCVRAGDEQLIARAADAALSRSRAETRASTASVLTELPVQSARSARAFGLARWQLAASMVAIFAFSLSGVGAALWVAGVAPWQKSQPQSAAPLQKPAQVRLHVRSKPAPRIEVAPLPLAPESLQVSLARGPARFDSEPFVLEKPAPRADHGHDAKALFHAANGARRAGDLTRAKRLYGELIAHAPASDEAHLSQVSLGKLLLAQGLPAAAERAFQGYLESGGGPLSEEALFSRAQCLLRLGRVGPERAAWRALLAAFPESVYATEAAQRLNLLAR